MGWGGLIAFIWLVTNTVCYPTVRLSFTSARTHTHTRHATLLCASLALRHIRHATLRCVSLALRQIRHARLRCVSLALRHIRHTTVRFSCTSAYPSYYATCVSLALRHICHATLRCVSLALRHIRHATLLCVLFHSFTYVMLRHGTFGLLCFASITVTTSWEVLPKWQTKKDEKKDL